MQKNMNEFLDEYLFNKKKRLKYSDLEEKVTQDDQEETPDEDQEEINPVNNDNVFEVTLDVNDAEATVRLEKGEFSRRAITDFVSVVSLFKNSREIPVKEFLVSVGVLDAAPPAETAPVTPDGSIEEPTTDPIKPTTTPITPTTTEAIGDEQEKQFNLNSFALYTKELVTQDSPNQVSINGVENVNNALSFKVMVNTDSFAFNTPESALAYFNKVFFDNIIKTIDRDIEED